MISLYITVGIVLFSYLFFFMIILVKQKKSQVRDVSMKYAVSIIISARNEEHNISALVHSLSQIDYPKEKFEILFFDDNSTDNTLSLAESELKSLSCNVRCFSGAINSIEGKKRGIAFLVENASNELLLFTDADVVVPVNWIKEMVSLITDKNIRMVCGPVAFEKQNSPYSKLMVIEFAAMVITSLLAINRKIPFMCNAANMMVFKSDYNAFCKQIDLNLKSGDDIFLLKAIMEKQGAGAICSNFNACVYTKAPNSIKEFLNQRIRWAGKNSKRFFANAFFVGLLIFMMAVSLITTFTIALITNSYILFSMVFIIKLIVDLIILKKYDVEIRLFRGWFFYSIILSMIYPLYIVIIGLLSLKPSYLWKGRVVH